MLNEKVEQQSKMVPARGDTVLIRHRTQTRSNGKCDLIFAADTEVRMVAATYLDSRIIRDSTGEPWLVMPCETGKAKWMTVE